jgi:hypothetical protein
MKNAMRVVDSNFDRMQARRGLTAKNQSQLTKLIPILQMGSKKGPDDATVQMKMEARIAALKELKANLNKIVVRLSDLYSLDEQTRLKRLTAARKKIKAIIEDRPPIGVSKALRAALNELTSLREGVFVGAAVTKKSLAILSCTNAVTEVQSAIDSTRVKLQAHKQEVEGGSSDPLFQNGDEIEQILEQTKKEGKALPVIKDKAFAIARVPIVVIPSKGFLNTEALSQSGFKADSVGGYAVIHNQLVLGINPKELIKLNKGQREQGKEIPREKWLEAADRVKKLIERQQKIKLTFVVDRPYGGGGGAWFWLMPEREASLLKNAFPGRAINVKQWGFAF